uniref:Excision repair cross-complementation group 6-like 2 n=1 Tax=Oreochromis niloticus TaxID=8128 RepID=A0A669F5M9_ORENI
HDFAAEWREGDSCLALHPRHGVLREATIQKLTSSSLNEDTAWVLFKDTNKDVGEEEQEAEAIPISKLMRPGLRDFMQEKPWFPTSLIDPRLCVPLELSDAHEDRVPYTINRYLRDYQREGIRFIYNNYIRSRGCILGDDMGLGKTVQVIGFLAAVLHKTGTWEDIANNRPQFLQSQQSSKQSNPSKVFLIVAPLSVLYNWKDELDTWGHFQCVVVHGLRKEEELARIRKGRVEIALTTYETLRLCLDQFNKIDWSAVVVDEAHKIKNPDSQITQAMKELRCKVRIGLTGTILQNNLEELWCVLDWAIPGCLDSLGHFKNKFSDPIEQGQRHSATKRALATGRKAVRALVRKISHWFFRRTKAIIKEQLPKKDDRVVYCSMTEFQQTVYQAVLDSEDVTLLLRSSEKCDCHSRRTRRSCCYKTNTDGVHMKELYFSYLAILRKVANHVALLQSTPGTSKKQEKYVSAVCAKVFQKFPEFVHRCKNEAFEALSDPMYSGKMKVLQKLLKFYLQKRDKVLIFSLSTKLLDVLESYCMAVGLDFSRLDGSTKSKERVQIVRDFNSSSHINLCLVSTMAGGLGLNFVGANVVVLFDPTWNPANDLQAIDRAYRIGQCRDVTVLRLISLGTVEEVIYLRQIYKQQLHSSVVGKESSRRYFEAVRGHGDHKDELFGIKNLFRLQTQGTCLTRKILEEAGGSSPTNVHVPNDKPAKEISDPSKVSTGVLDFSSEEDERKASNLSTDDWNRSRNATTGPGRMSLQQHGFSKLLERVKEAPALEGETSPEDEGSCFEEDPEEKKREDTSTSSTGNVGVPLGTETRDTSCNSDRKLRDNGRQDGDTGLKRQISEIITVDEDCNKNSKLEKNKGYSDESEDFDLEAKSWSKKDALYLHDGGERGKGRTDYSKKRQSASERDKRRSKYTQDIETFSSSEEEHVSPHMERSRVKLQKLGQRPVTGTTEKEALMPKAVSFTTLKSQTNLASKEKNGTIDCMLGGVQEVVYTHSNQRVVGGSKAEELISRAAVRDVFERKMYSQLPISEITYKKNSEPCHSTMRLQELSLDHPVTFTSKSVHHTKHNTFIIGETPKAIRRQQLEEMAEKFKFPTVHQFAVEILSKDSTQRLALLHQYYTSLNLPELADTVKNNFPQPVSAQASPSAANSEIKNPQKDASKATKNLIFTQKNLRTKPETSEKTPVPPKKARNSKGDAPKPRKKQRISQRNVLEPLSDVPSPESEEQDETHCSARGLKRTKGGSVSTSGAHIAGGGLGGDRSSLRMSETLQREQRENSQPPSISTNRSYLTELIGDTSILDDLLKPKPKSTQHIPKTPPVIETTARASKGSRKDFWDILNEGNEESINRLTDPEEVQRVCITTNFAARTVSVEKDSKSLWKTNEKPFPLHWTVSNRETKSGTSGRS